MPNTSNEIAEQIGIDHVIDLAKRIEESEIPDCCIPEFGEALSMLLRVNVQLMSQRDGPQKAVNSMTWMDVGKHLAMHSPWAFVACFVVYVGGKYVGAL